MREITLTFDDGPHPKLTPKLLDVLAENNIKAVFFVLGQLVKTLDGKKTVSRMISDGHAVGNHTYSHCNLKNLSLDKARDEILRTNDLICELGGKCSLFRPPYGAMNSALGCVLLELGYQNVMWSVDTEDWKRKQNADWVNHGLEQLQRREDAIVLMHDIHPTTVESVPSFIDKIRSLRNVEFVLY